MKMVSFIVPALLFVASDGTIETETSQKIPTKKVRVHALSKKVAVANQNGKEMNDVISINNIISSKQREMQQCNVCYTALYDSCVTGLVAIPSKFSTYYHYTDTTATCRSNVCCGTLEPELAGYVCCIQQSSSNNGGTSSSSNNGGTSSSSNNGGTSSSTNFGGTSSSSFGTARVTTNKLSKGRRGTVISLPILIFIGVIALSVWLYRRQKLSKQQQTANSKSIPDTESNSNNNNDTADMSMETKPPPVVKIISIRPPTSCPSTSTSTAPNVMLPTKDKPNDSFINSLFTGIKKSKHKIDVDIDLPDNVNINVNGDDVPTEYDETTNNYDEEVVQPGPPAPEFDDVDVQEGLDGVVEEVVVDPQNIFAAGMSSFFGFTQQPEEEQQQY
jgi:hypothetical protein